MGKTLENKDLYAPDEFPNLEYILLDVRKTLRNGKITPDNPRYELLLDTAIRTTLLKGKFGILMPSQPSSEKAEWFINPPSNYAPKHTARFSPENMI